MVIQAIQGAIVHFYDFRELNARLADLRNANCLPARGLGIGAPVASGLASDNGTTGNPDPMPSEMETCVFKDSGM